MLCLNINCPHWYDYDVSVSFPAKSVMKLSGFFTALQALSVVGSTIIYRNNEQDDFINVITQPATGTAIQPSQLFPFHYLPGSRCNLLYTPVRIWLLDHQPSLSDFDSNGSLLGPSLNYWGEYVTINIGTYTVLFSFAHSTLLI